MTVADVVARAATARTRSSSGTWVKTNQRSGRSPSAGASAAARGRAPRAGRFLSALGAARGASRSESHRFSALAPGPQTRSLASVLSSARLAPLRLDLRRVDVLGQDPGQPSRHVHEVSRDCQTYSSATGITALTDAFLPEQFAAAEERGVTDVMTMPWAYYHGLDVGLEQLLIGEVGGVGGLAHEVTSISAIARISMARSATPSPSSGWWPIRTSSSTWPAR